MSDEQRVRTMAGWIGVEISKSRVRTPGKAGYGLWRVRGSELMDVTRTGSFGRPYEQRTEWTAYAFELDVIEAQVGNAIGRGTPEKPADLHLPKTRVRTGEFPYATVPTRWTSAYGGRRDLGAGEPPSVDAALRPDTVRSRQRAANAEFQKAHLKRRAHGLKVRYALKEARKTQPNRTQE